MNVDHTCHEEGTGFDSIIYLGRHPIKDPKNEADIHAQIRENNALYDLGSGREACKAVKVQVGSGYTRIMSTFQFNYVLRCEAKKRPLAFKPDTSEYILDLKSSVKFLSSSFDMLVLKFHCVVKAKIRM